MPVGIFKRGRVYDLYCSQSPGGDRHFGRAVRLRMVSTDNGFKRILWAQFLLILENSLISCEHNLNIPQLPAEYQNFTTTSAKHSRAAASFSDLSQFLKSLTGTCFTQAIQRLTSSKQRRLLSVYRRFLVHQRLKLYPSWDGGRKWSRKTSARGGREQWHLVINSRNYVNICFLDTKISFASFYDMKLWGLHAGVLKNDVTWLWFGNITGFVALLLTY